MSRPVFKALSGASIPKNRHFWFGMILFAWVIFTGVMLFMDWQESTRWMAFRRIVQMIIFSIWGVDRFAKYRAQQATQVVSREG